MGLIIFFSAQTGLRKSRAIDTSSSATCIGPYNMQSKQLL